MSTEKEKRTADARAVIIKTCWLLLDELGKRRQMRFRDVCDDTPGTTQRLREAIGLQANEDPFYAIIPAVAVLSRKRLIVMDRAWEVVLDDQKFDFGMRILESGIRFREVGGDFDDQDFAL